MVINGKKSWRLYKFNEDQVSNILSLAEDHSSSETFPAGTGIITEKTTDDDEE